MSVALNELLDLSISERIDLALKLWESIPDKTENITLSQRDEIELDDRYKEHQKNPKAGKTWEQIKSGLKNN